MWDGPVRGCGFGQLSGQDEEDSRRKEQRDAVCTGNVLEAIVQQEGIELSTSAPGWRLPAPRPDLHGLLGTDSPRHRCESQPDGLRGLWLDPATGRQGWRPAQVSLSFPWHQPITECVCLHSSPQDGTYKPS